MRDGIIASFMSGGFDRLKFCTCSAARGKTESMLTVHLVRKFVSIILVNVKLGKLRSSISYTLCLLCELR